MTALRGLYPARVDAVDLAAAYVFPENDSPWLRANFVASVDGAATLDGRAGGLGNAADRRIFALLRALADVVLVGAGTVRVEGYGPVEVAAEWAHLRDGRPPTPPIAVVSHRLDLNLSGQLFTSAPAHARTIVLTGAAAPGDRLRAVSSVAEVILAGDELVDPVVAVDVLAQRGFRRISCEGGPRLLADIVAAGCLDELCLTCSPLMVSGAGPRIANGPAPQVPLALRLAQVLADDSYLYLRYIRASAGARHTKG